MTRKEAFTKADPTNIDILLINILSKQDGVGKSPTNTYAPKYLISY